eukprot:15392233-Alexandrium_andersonii.AAC.1
MAEGVGGAAHDPCGGVTLQATTGRKRPVSQEAPGSEARRLRGPEACAPAEASGALTDRPPEG